MLRKGVYLITDRVLSGGREAEAVEAACRAGVRMVQYREKEMGFGWKAEKAKELRGICREYGAGFFVNDEPDIALLCRADGVHLGQGDLEGLERAGEGGLMVGISASTVEQAVQASGIADYVGFGPVFKTETKKDAGKPTGVQELGKAVKASAVPIYAIGGIGKGNAEEAMNAGAYGVAVISEIMGAADFYSASLELAKKVEPWI